MWEGRTSDVWRAFVDDRLVGCEAGDRGFQGVHVGVLEDVDHHDDLVEPVDDQLKPCSRFYGLTACAATFRESEQGRHLPTRLSS